MRVPCQSGDRSAVASPERDSPFAAEPWSVLSAYFRLHAPVAWGTPRYRRVLTTGRQSVGVPKSACASRRADDIPAPTEGPCVKNPSPSLFGVSWVFVMQQYDEVRLDLAEPAGFHDFADTRATARETDGLIEEGFVFAAAGQPRQAIAQTPQVALDSRQMLTLVELGCRGALIREERPGQKPLANGDQTSNQWGAKSIEQRLQPCLRRCDASKCRSGQPRSGLLDPFA